MSLQQHDTFVVEDDLLHVILNVEERLNELISQNGRYRFTNIYGVVNFIENDEEFETISNILCEHNKTVEDQERGKIGFSS